MRVSGFFSRFRLGPSGEGSVAFWGSMVVEDTVRFWDGDVERMENGVVGLDTAVTKRDAVQSTSTITRSGHQTYG